MTGVLGLCLVVTVGAAVPDPRASARSRGRRAQLGLLHQAARADGPAGGGLANALYGSCMLVGLATLFAVPVGCWPPSTWPSTAATAWARSVRFVGELLGGVPSIVIGIFAYYALVRR